jgi:acyl-CoA thioester hydrolase
MPPRRKKVYFETVGGAAEPVAVNIGRRVRFSEVDVMGIVWHGRYALFFEEASAELGRRCGLSYRDFYEAELRAPIVEFHVDYYRSLYLDEEFEIRAAMFWHDGARINTEYHLVKQDGTLAASGYTVQLFTAAKTGEVCIVSPPLLERCRGRWKSGEFYLPV